MFCSNCGQSLPEGAKFCPKCGTPTVPQTTTLPDRLKTDTSWRYKVIAAAAVLLLIVCVIAFSSRKKPDDDYNYVVNNTTQTSQPSNDQNPSKESSDTSSSGSRPNGNSNNSFSDSQSYESGSNSSSDSLPNGNDSTSDSAQSYTDDSYNSTSSTSYTSQNGKFSCEVGYAVVERDDTQYIGTAYVAIRNDKYAFDIGRFLGSENIVCCAYPDYLSSGADFDLQDLYNQVSGSTMLIANCPLPSSYSSYFVNASGDDHYSRYLTDAYFCVEQLDANGIATVYFKASVTNDSGETTYEGFAVIDMTALASGSGSSSGGSIEVPSVNLHGSYKCAVCINGKCRVCDGKGIASYTIGHQQVRCSACGGSGKCAACGGTGEVTY